MKVTYGPGGWARIEDATYVIYLRFSEDQSLADLVIEGGSRGISPRLVRSMPLGRYVAAALSRRDLLFGWGMFHSPEAAAFASRVHDGLTGEEGVFGFASQALSRPRKRIRLAPPAEIALSDAFLRDVAAAYLDAVRHGERPNIALANQSGHPKRTVERWVYRARQKGFLPPAAPRGGGGVNG